MVTVDQVNILCLRAGFEDLRAAAQLQVFDQGDGIALGERGAVGILDHPRDFRRGLFGPLMAASGAFPMIGQAEDVVEGAGRAGGLGHR